MDFAAMFIKLITKNGLVAAFIIIGITTWIAYKIGGLTKGLILDPAIAIFFGLILAYIGGVDFEEDYREVTGWSAVGKEAIPADVDMGKTTRTCNAEGAGEPSPQPEPLFMPYPDMKRGSWTILFLFPCRTCTTSVAVFAF